METLNNISQKADQPYLYGYPSSAPLVYPITSDSQAVEETHKPRVLLFSLRNIDQAIFRGSLYEFEDIIMSVDAVHLLSPRRESRSGGKFYRSLETKVRQHLGIIQRPDLVPIRIEGEYDLFFAVFHFARDIGYLHHVKDWRRRSRKAVCFILEQWQPEIELLKPYLEMLGEFDQVFVFSRWSIPEMRSISGRPVDYLASGTDALASCPYPHPPLRTIDVYSIGRRIPSVHMALLRLMQAEQLTYLFDSVIVGSVPSIDYAEHRSLVRHLLKRSRYYLAYRHNDSEYFRSKTGGEESISSRYFEAIAGGPVILGSFPDCDDYRTNFNWPDATIPIPFDDATIEDSLKALDFQPERLMRTRLNNIVNALRRHDWVYRWRIILQAAGLSNFSRMEQRISRLHKLADLVEKQSINERCCDKAREDLRAFFG